MRASEIKVKVIFVREGVELTLKARKGVRILDILRYLDVSCESCVTEVNGVLRTERDRLYSDCELRVYTTVYQGHIRRLLKRDITIEDVKGS